MNYLLNHKLFVLIQAFKLIVTDPDSVLSGLTKEVKETNADGLEVGPDPGLLDLCIAQHLSIHFVMLLFQRESSVSKQDVIFCSRWCCFPVNESRTSYD